MEVWNLVLSVISHQHQNRALILDDTSFDERPHSLVESFPNHIIVVFSSCTSGGSSGFVESMLSKIRKTKEKEQQENLLCD